MNFESFREIICTNFQTATLKKYHDAEKKIYNFTFTYLDFYKEFIIEESSFRYMTEETLAFHMKTVIECEYVKFELNKQKKPISAVEVEKTIPKRMRKGKSKTKKEEEL